MATRCWQVRATYPGGRVLMFGIEARGEPQALLKAYRRMAELPGVADHLTMTRLYGRHHPLYAANRTAVQTGVDEGEADG